MGKLFFLVLIVLKKLRRRGGRAITDIEGFLGKYVALGVLHEIIPRRLFFYFGILKYVDATDVKIEINNGFRIIPISQIWDIQWIKRGDKPYD